MSVAIRPCTKYQIEYGNVITYSDDIYEFLRWLRSKNKSSLYISEYEDEIELDFDEAYEIITENDVPRYCEMLKRAVEQSDKRNSYMHLSVW